MLPESTLTPYIASPHGNCFMKKKMLKNPYIPLIFASSEHFFQLHENLHRSGTIDNGYIIVVNEQKEPCSVFKAYYSSINVLGWISRRWGVGMWTGLGWPRIETGGGRL